MFFQKSRVEQDLARIRNANLPEKYPPPEVPEKGKKKREKVKAEDRIGVKDVLAMIIAVFSLILPYVIAFIAIMAIVVLGWLWLFG